MRWPWLSIIVLLLPSVAVGQSLGAAAEKEKKRRQAAGAGEHPKVVTDEELVNNKGRLANEPSRPPGTAPAAGDAATLVAPKSGPSGGDARGTPSAWMARASEARARIKAAEDALRTLQEHAKEVLRRSSRIHEDLELSEVEKQVADATRRVEEARNSLAAVEEEARRKGVPSGWLEGNGGPSESGSPAAEPDAAQRKADWQDRFAQARARLRSAEEKVAKTALTVEFTTKYPFSPDKVAAEAAHKAALSEREVAQQGLVDLEEEARRAGVPPGWLRE